MLAWIERVRYDACRAAKHQRHRCRKREQQLHGARHGADCPCGLAATAAAPDSMTAGTVPGAQLTARAGGYTQLMSSRAAFAAFAAFPAIAATLPPVSATALPPALPVVLPVIAAAPVAAVAAVSMLVALPPHVPPPCHLRTPPAVPSV